MLLPLPLLLWAATAQQPDIQPAPPIKDLVEVQLSGRSEAHYLYQVASDPHDHGGIDEQGRAWIFADDAEQDHLASLGFRLNVVQEDLSAFYAARAKQNPAPRGVGGSMGGFKTLAEINQAMDDLQAAYPNLVSPKYSLGTSIQGRPIWAMRISDNPTVDEAAEPVAWFDAIHHAREPMSGESLLLFAEWLCDNYGSDPEVTRMVESRNIVFVPCVNPDGYEYNRQTNPSGGGMWRKNRRNNGGGSYGVDLNRNYDWEWGPQWSGSSGNPDSDIYRGTAPFSEPESQAIRDELAAHPPGMSISAHTFSNLWIYPWGYSTVYTPDDAQFRWYGQQMTATSGYIYGTAWEVLYTANGVSTDHHYGVHSTFAFTPEIGGSSDGFWPSPSRIPALFEDVRPGYVQITKWTGGWLETPDFLWQEISGDGDAFQEAGETWQVQLDFGNPGVADVNASIQLSSPTADITVLQGNASVLASAYGSGTSSALQLRFESGAQSGVPYALDLSLSYDTVTTVEPLVIVLGRPRLLFRDDMEDADYGWSVSDNTHYSWERANPQQTTSSGQTCQPENDNSNPGTLCWVTGAAAGSSAGTNDVDGTTVLTSPIFRAGGFQSATLSYARWFANLPGSGLDDVLEVEISDNGGSTWTLLEQTGNANSWQTVSFALENYVTLNDNLRLRFTVSDSPNNDLTEGLLDDLELQVYSTLPTLGAWGEIGLGSSVKLFLEGPANVGYQLKYSFTADSGTVIPGIDGLQYLTGSIKDLLAGSFDGEGRAVTAANVPNNPTLSGRTIYLQALVDAGGPEAAFSNLLTVIVL